MELKSLYREIVNEHNLEPSHKHEISGANFMMLGVNPSCGDDIMLKLKVEDGVIEDGGFTGSGCAISQASVDMMLDCIIGKTVEEAVACSTLFHDMIRGKITDEGDLESLEESAALIDIAHMPARVKCATLGWRTLKEMLEEEA